MSAAAASRNHSSITPSSIALSRIAPQRLLRFRLTSNRPFGRHGRWHDGERDDSFKAKPLQDLSAVHPIDAGRSRQRRAAECDIFGAHSAETTAESTVTPVGTAHRPLIALTGATGFIGQHLLRELPKRGYRLRVLLRRPSVVPMDAASAVVGDLARPQNMSAALADVDAVIHSAGIAHTMSGLPEDDYRVLNTEATIALARAAQRAGAKRFVFLSSIRAQCGATAERVLTEELAPQPTDAYGRSKLAAERGLSELALDWVALRLVLVYGPGVKGNMAELVRFARTPYPLPLGALGARRSLLSLDNLVAAVDAVLGAPGPLRRPFIAADPEALTIPEMIAAVRRGLGRRPGLVPVPPALLEVALRALGRSEVYQRLAGSLVADASALRKLGWTPPVATAEGLAALARS
jgi:UDP-glucose 4-epimerase